MRRVLAGVLLAVAAAALPLWAGEIPGALLMLETAPGTPGSDPEGAPPRFVLLKDGQVFVGGSSLVEAGRLERQEVRSLQKRAAELRKIPGIGSPIAFGGPAESVFRLRLLEGKPLEIIATGDPALAPRPLAALGTLLQDLARFHHACLRPYAPSTFSLKVREGRLPGGCRAWPFPVPIAEALAAPLTVPAVDAASWPTGAMPASVCAHDRRYVVTLRPLLPDEQP